MTLYVNSSDSGTTASGCLQAAPCPTIQDAINAAEGPSFMADPVTIDLASGAYDESDTIGSPNPSLSIVGAGSSNTTLDDGLNGSDLTISAGTVNIIGLTITNGAALDGADGSNVGADGDPGADGGGIDDADASAVSIFDSTISGITAVSVEMAPKLRSAVPAAAQPAGVAAMRATAAGSR